MTRRYDKSLSKGASAFPWIASTFLHLPYLSMYLSPSCRGCMLRGEKGDVLSSEASHEAVSDDGGTWSQLDQQSVCFNSCRDLWRLLMSTHNPCGKTNRHAFITAKQPCFICLANTLATDSEGVLTEGIYICYSEIASAFVNILTVNSSWCLFTP